MFKISWLLSSVIPTILLLQAVGADPQPGDKENFGPLGAKASAPETPVVPTGTPDVAAVDKGDKPKGGKFSPLAGIKGALASAKDRIKKKFGDGLGGRSKKKSHHGDGGGNSLRMNTNKGGSELGSSKSNPNSESQKKIPETDVQGISDPLALLQNAIQARAAGNDNVLGRGINIKLGSDPNSVGIASLATSTNLLKGVSDPEALLTSAIEAREAKAKTPVTLLTSAIQAKLGSTDDILGRGINIKTDSDSSNLLKGVSDPLALLTSAIQAREASTNNVLGRGINIKIGSDSKSVGIASIATSAKIDPAFNSAASAAPAAPAAPAESAASAASIASSNNLLKDVADPVGLLTSAIQAEDAKPENAPENVLARGLTDTDSKGVSDPLSMLQNAIQVRAKTSGPIAMLKSAIQTQVTGPDNIFARSLKADSESVAKSTNLLKGVSDPSALLNSAIQARAARNADPVTLLQSVIQARVAGTDVLGRGLNADASSILLNGVSDPVALLTSALQAREAKSENIFARSLIPNSDSVSEAIGLSSNLLKGVSDPVGLLSSAIQAREARSENVFARGLTDSESKGVSDPLAMLQGAIKARGDPINMLTTAIKTKVGGTDSVLGKSLKADSDLLKGVSDPAALLQSAIKARGAKLKTENVLGRSINIKTDPDSSMDFGEAIEHKKQHNVKKSKDHRPDYKRVVEYSDSDSESSGTEEKHNSHVKRTHSGTHTPHGREHGDHKGHSALKVHPVRKEQYVYRPRKHSKTAEIPHHISPLDFITYIKANLEIRHKKSSGKHQRKTHPAHYDTSSDESAFFEDK